MILLEYRWIPVILDTQDLNVSFTSKGCKFLDINRSKKTRKKRVKRKNVVRSHMWCHQELTLPICMWQTLMWHWHEQKSSRIKQTFVLTIVPSSSSNSVYFCALWGFLMFLTRELNLIASLGSGFARTSRRDLLSTARISYGLCSTPT